MRFHEKSVQSTEKQESGLVQGKKPKTFGIKKAPVQLWTEMVYFIIILGKVINYLTTHLQVHSNPTEKTWLIM